MGEAERRAVERYWEAFNERDLSLLDDVIAADYVNEAALPDTPPGPAGQAQVMKRLWAAFPDARVERTGERLSDGRFVAAPCKLLGTHRGEIEGLGPTGRFLVVHLVFYCELDPDRARMWRVRAFFDAYDAAVQLGVLPARGTLGEKALLMLRGFGLRARG